MFSGRQPPFQILLGAAFHFLCNPILSLMSSPLGLKESIGGSVTELGRSRPPHRAKATIGRGRDPRSGKAAPQGAQRPRAGSAASGAQRAQRASGRPRPELAGKNRQKSGAGGDRGADAQRPRSGPPRPNKPPSRLAAKASKPPRGAAKKY